MKILAINGSPKGSRSNTLTITNSFIDGLNKGDNHVIDRIEIKDKDIEHCIGCFNCWTKTPGKCIISDDMEVLTDKYINADLVIWSFPLYYFGMPSKTKSFLDRLLPTNLPYMINNGEEGSGHPSRYDLSKQRHVLISSCGFYSTKNNYEGLFKQFEILVGEKFSKIICPEGELINVPQLKGRVNQYLSVVVEAGVEYSKKGEFSEDTCDKLSELLYPPNTYIEMSDSSWEICEPSSTKDNSNKCYHFLRQMSTVYNPSAWQGKDVVIEMYFTDVSERYQLILGKEKCDLKRDNLIEYTTRIETSFSLWKKISSGEVNGAKAMMEKKYKVQGDFNTMLNMDKYFGTDENIVSTKENEVVNDKGLKTNMNVLLLPWIILWVLLPINSIIGGIVSIVIASIVPLLSYRFKLTVNEKVSVVIVSTLGMLAILGMEIEGVICLSYLCFGLMWLVSSLVAIPLTAKYSCNDYDGEKAFKNPLFIRTNRILTIMWGGLYFIVSAYTYLLINSPVYNYIGLINAVPTILMGIFTVWFSKWYPAKVARG